MRYAGEVYKPEGLPQGEGELSREERKRARASKKRAGKKHRAQKVLLLHITTLARLHHKTQSVATAWNMLWEGLGCAHACKKRAGQQHRARRCSSVASRD